MRYKAAIDSEPKLVALVDAAQDEPVFIERGSQEVAVLVSAREYTRLSSAANLDFQEFCDLVSDKAATQGLTESKLDDLLNNA
jgi:PHD/YefM family antitoxin component YafN of YafNO toxin-antitoxin module